MEQRIARVKGDTLNPVLENVHYAVRGEIVQLAGDLDNKLREGVKLPFENIIYCNIGNPQSLKQKPITFIRQVLALIEYPELIESAPHLFPADVIRRAKFYLESTSRNGTGPYSHSQGMEIIRKEVVNFIMERDGYPANFQDIFLTNGASAGIDLLFKAILRDSNDGIMISIPQYPLYSATIPLYRGVLVPYYLEEATEWSLSIEELERSHKKAVDSGVSVRAIVVINPGNPTGQALCVENQREIIEFCKRRNVALFADEVYQENIYKDGASFTSFRKVLLDMGDDYKDVQLISFHSVSKGFLGECGKRGGYFELLNFDAEFKAQIYKLSSVSLCSNLTGQYVVGIMVNPPKEGDESYVSYTSEKNAILSSLKRRSLKLVAALNQLEGVSCQPAGGAMYAFPSVHLPLKFVELATSLGKLPDMLYCVELLESTGICVVPGSGFGQVEGTYHFRTTFLPPEDQIDKVIERFSTFHRAFMARYVN